MYVPGMEAVAHHAENLLGLVRDGGAPMTEPMLDGLLEAVDCLKGQRDAAIRARADSEAPPALLQRLDALFEAAGGSDAAAEPAAAQAAAPSGLGDDEMLGIFAELLQARLPELARAFDADEGGRIDLVDTLNSLEHAAGVMEFDQVAETVGGLKEFLAARALPLDPAARAEATDRIAQVALQARLLNEVVGGDAGAAGLSEALAGVLIEDRRRTLAGLAAALGALERSAHDGAPDGYRPAAADAATLAHAARDRSCNASPSSRRRTAAAGRGCLQPRRQGRSSADRAARLDHAVRRRDGGGGGRPGTRLDGRRLPG